MNESPSIDLTCSKCSKIFREHHSKIRHGLKLSCPACSQPIAFDNEAQDPNIQKALSAARRYRLRGNANAPKPGSYFR
jgi:DNA-directed RNA polymerase subunit RPC12/RpoP